jgi:tRNA threonylcarbamoyladenosine biosynthesis protein TsaB
MRLLAIETSTEACSVALLVDGAVSERFEVAPRRHAELVLPWLEALLAEAGVRRRDLDAIAVSRGPGAFTGVRLGISIAQGIALALDRPLLPVSTLAVLAQGGLRDAAGQGVLAAIDARMGEVYFGAFARDGDGVRALDGEVVASPDAVVPPAGGPWHGVGTGFAAADGALARNLGDRLARVDASALPRAADLARLAARAHAAGAGMAPEAVEPAYLRDSVALTLSEQAAARARRG